MDFQAKIACPQCAGSGKVYAVDFEAMREYRIKLGVSLSGASKRIGISAAFLCDIEKGRRGCPLKVLAFYRDLK
jgi:hypothetical protein